MPKTRSVEECAAEFLLEKTAGETRRAYDRSLKDFLTYAKAETPEDLSGVDRAAVVRFRNYLRESRKCSPAYVNRALSAVSGLFKWLLVEEVIQTNPCDLVRRYKVSAESRTEGLSEEEVQAMIDATKDGSLRGLRDRAILVTLYYEGLRRGSLARLDLRDLRGHRQMLVLRETKTSDYKEIPLRREVERAIDDYVTVLETERGISLGERDPVFVSLSDRAMGLRLTPDAILKVVKARARQAGIRRRVVAHSMRHATATHALDHGAKIEEVAELLTHDEIRSTQKYDRKRKGRSKAAAAALPSMAI
jgi:site-specific recombinase XerD